MAMFDEYYDRIETCLDHYLREKNGGGWTDQVKEFKKTTLQPIKASENYARLYKETEIFSNRLYTYFNAITFGWTKGSQLKENLEEILSDMLKVSEAVLTSEAVPAPVLTASQEAAAPEAELSSVLAPSQEITSVSDEVAPPELPPRPVLASTSKPDTDTSTDLSKMPLVMLVPKIAPKLEPQRRRLFKKTSS